MVSLFLTLDLLLIVQGLFSIIEGRMYLVSARRTSIRRFSDFAPPVCIICPCKGIDFRLEENLAALLNQAYPDYSVIFVTGSAGDPARPVIERAISNRRNAGRSFLVAALPNPSRGEKVNNLLCALNSVESDREVLVFADSDACPHPTWLLELVQPLAELGVGASTGYRWYLPATGGFWSKLLSAWNGSVATTLGDHGRNFAWGGSTAIRRDVFERTGVAQAWANAVSDDYALTRAIQDAGLKIKFVPSCLLVSRENATLSSLIEFTTRQVIITRVYRPAAWWVGFISHSLFVFGFFGQLALLICRFVPRLAFGSEAHATNLAGPASSTYPIAGAYLIAGICLALIYLLGSVKGFQRIKAALLVLPASRREILGCWWMFCLLWPLVSLLFLYNFIRSATTRRIVWRGTAYELRSPSETVVLDPTAG
ncbi:MAG TPA: glycosyltransferase family 2 protein [Blastocatellia bacterium]